MNETYIPEAWGWKGEFHAAWAAAADADPAARALLPARVTGREHHRYEVVCPDFSGRPDFRDLPAIAGRRRDITVTGRFEYGAAGPADFPAPGDWVLVDPAEASLRIHAVLPRRSSLSRGMAGPRSEEQVLAANIDTLFLVFALDGGRNFLVRLLERGLVVAKNAGAAPCIVLNKADLAAEEDRERALAEAAYAAPTVPVVALSAKTGEGLDRLAAYLSAGETVGMLGKSGVGKSALVNALGSYRGGRGGAAAATGAAGAAAAAGAESQGADSAAGGSEAGDSILAREGRIRADDLRGRHTTTSSRLYRLESGILLIDSPGIRELKIWGDAESLDGGFPEIAELALRCRFSDCAHAGEVGCAVQEALSAGELDPARYEAYLALVKEQAWLERRTDERAQREEKQKWKQIAKFQKEFKKNGR